MSTLNQYLVQKRQAALDRKEKALQLEEIPAQTYYAKARALGRSGVREIRIRDFQVILQYRLQAAYHLYRDSRKDSRSARAG